MDLINLVEDNANLHTLPPDLLIPIFKLAIGLAEDTIIGRPSANIATAILPMTHICHQIRSTLVRYPPFWARVSSKMSRDMQIACLARSQGANIHVSVVCPSDTQFADAIFTLQTATPYSHHWTSFHIVLPSEALQMHSAQYCEARRCLMQQLSAPRLQKIRIRYIRKSGQTDFSSSDIGGYGGFYTKWNVPLLTDLTVIDYFPYPAIASTVTTLTAKFNNRLNDSHLHSSLPNATSLKELHFVFSAGAGITGLLDSSSLYEQFVTQLPGIEALSITVCVRKGWTQSIERTAIFVADIFRFPNISSFSLVIDGRNESRNHCGNLHVLLHRLRTSFLRPLDVLKLDGSKAGKLTTIKTSRLLPAATELKILGKCWNISSREARDVSGVVDVFQVLEELTLVDCAEGVASFLEGLRGSRRDKLRVARATNCTPELLKKLEQIIRPEILQA